MSPVDENLSPLQHNLQQLCEHFLAKNVTIATGSSHMCELSVTIVTEGSHVYAINESDAADSVYI